MYPKGLFAGLMYQTALVFGSVYLITGDSVYTDNICVTHTQNTTHTRSHTPELILSAVLRQTAGINLQTDLGDEDACIQNSFDVLQPP